jgi:hypothetical protein
MPNSELKRVLEALHNTVESAQQQQTSAQLDALQDRVQTAIEQPHPSLREQLEDSLYQLEAEHPQIAQVIRMALDELNSLGI